MRDDVLIEAVARVEREAEHGEKDETANHSQRDRQRHDVLVVIGLLCRRFGSLLETCNTTS